MRPHTRTHCSRKGECDSPVGEHIGCAGRGGGPLKGIAQGLMGVPYRGPGVDRPLSFVELPAEIIIKILEYMSFKENSKVRLVCRRLNELCAARLNSTFQRLLNNMLVRFQSVKSQMPRRESARRNHPLARECDIIEILHMRLTLLQMTFGKHIDRKHICFFPGEILDEVLRIVSYISSTQPLGRSYKTTVFQVTDELDDLSNMAMEYFKENIEPSLPEITYFGSDFLDFTPPFATPSKRLNLPPFSCDSRGAGVGFDSPISSRASAVGSSCSEPPLAYNQLDSVEGDYEEGVVGASSAPQSNMVLRKRIRRIRAGMKKYNSQLDEVKKELKACKSKMDGQSKQVSEYVSRLDEYDKKFEENSRRFGTLLTELNKCKTELQYYRSKSHLMQCLSCGGSLPPEPYAGPQAEAVCYESPLNLSQQASSPAKEPADQAAFGLQSLDKAAMVADWLNPEHMQACNSEDLQHNLKVQDFKAPSFGLSQGHALAPSTSQGQRNVKTDDDYLYLRSGSPRSPDSSPGSPSGSGLGRAASKRKSRDEKSGVGGGAGGVSGCKATATRCKRPKVSNAN